MKLGEADLDVLRRMCGGDALSSFGKIPRGDTEPVFRDYFLKDESSKEATPVAALHVRSLESKGLIRRKGGLPPEVAGYELTEEGIAVVAREIDGPDEEELSPSMTDALVSVMVIIEPLTPEARRRVLRACLELEA